MAQLVAYVGTYGVAPGTKGGGIFGLSVSDDGKELLPLSYMTEPRDAGYLVYAPETSTLYVVDERKTDGRGPVDEPSAVHAIDVNRKTGALSWRNSQPAPGPRPTFLDYSPEHRLIVSANHGDFQHVEKVVQFSDGTWGSEFVYDDSTLLVFPLESDGRLCRVSDVHVFSGHGMDPNSSPQNAGHAQASPHAHCAVIDPSGRFVLVGDKGTDRIEVFRLGQKLEMVFSCQLKPQAGPRHIAFDSVTGLAFVTLEFASQIASFEFDARTGELKLLDAVTTLRQPCDRCNEPAEVRVHPAGRYVYVNNRGEDSLAWFEFNSAGSIRRLGDVPLAASIHPGLAARSFTFDPSGSFLLVADRPAGLVRSYAVNGETGELIWQADTPVPDPAYIVFVELDGAAVGNSELS